MPLIVIVGLAFSNVATSASHSLRCPAWLVGGSQGTVIVTGPSPPAGAAALLPPLLPLEHAAADRLRPATRTRAAVLRTAGRWAELFIEHLPGRNYEGWEWCERSSGDRCETCGGEKRRSDVEWASP